MIVTIIMIIITSILIMFIIVVSLAISMYRSKSWGTSREGGV